MTTHTAKIVEMVRWWTATEVRGLILEVADDAGVRRLPGMFTVHLGDERSIDRAIELYQTTYLTVHKNDDGTFTGTCGAWAIIDPVAVKAAILVALA